MSSHREPKENEYVVIGAGPAGLQCGYYLQRAGRDYRILERASAAGTFFSTYPRVGSLISLNKVHSIYDDPEVQLRWDWNSLLTEEREHLFREYSRRYFPTSGDMVRYLQGFAERFDLAIDYETPVARISRRSDGTFELRDQGGGLHRCRYLIVATGMGVPYVPPIPGIELAEGYEDVSMDPQDFEGQVVLVLGKGNSGLEVANNVLETASLIHVASPDPIQLAWNTKHPGHVRAQQAIFLDTYQLKTLNSLLDCTVQSIERRNGRYAVSVAYTHAQGECETLYYDRVIRCAGFRFDASIFDEECRPRLSHRDRMPEMSSTWESTGVKGLYFAGTLMQARDFRRAASAFVDGFRYNIRTLHHLMEWRHHGGELPGKELAPTSEALTEEIVERMNWSSGLWTQFGYLADVALVGPEDTEARILYELPVDFIRTEVLKPGCSAFVLTLEWGREVHPDVFAIPRFPDAGLADRSAFLHPIIRHYAGAELVAEHHVLENLFGIWRDPEEHIRPLRRFFDDRLRSSAGTPSSRVAASES